MHAELPPDLELRLRDLASAQGRDIGTLLEEALRHYLDAVAVDLDASDLAQAQIQLLDEVALLPGWTE